MTGAVAMGLLAAAGAYLYGVERVWRAVGRGRLVTGRQVACGLAALAWAAAAVAPPLDAAAHRLLAAHMVQHLVLLLPVPVLLAHSRVGVALLWLLPAARRRRLARRWPPVRTWARSSGWLAAVWTLHVVVVLAWHLPSAYEAAVRVPAIHLLEHTTMVATGLAVWWTVLRTRAFGAGAVYAAATGMAGSALGVLMVFSGAAWYPVYEATAAVQGTSALADQQTAGAVMWVAGAAGYLLLATWLFVAWLRRVEQHPDDRWRRQVGSLST